jgi:sulfur-carrier protein
MPINIIAFGRLTDIIGSDNLIMEDVTDTESLLSELTSKYPALSTSKYIIAVDKKLITGKTVINPGSTVVLMPPFSGG